MKAVILAAGVGSRLRPLTDACPKPMLPIAGRPLLARTLDWLRASGVTEAALNLHHLPDVERDGLGDGSIWGMTLRYSYESELLGSAGALRTITQRFPGWLDQTFALIYGDMLCDIDLAALLEAHHSAHAILTLALKHTATPRTQGMIELDPTGRVRRFVEKPAEWSGGNLANAGVYLCEPALIDIIPAGFSDFGHNTIPALLAANANICGHLATG
ncbi:MAG: nucleotidyltransferase family protein, partial [Roseiflexaceae bacterium]